MVTPQGPSLNRPHSREMQRGVAAVVVACAAAGGAIWYSHAAQVAQKKRMHQGVLREIALEEHARSLANQSPAAADTPDCDNGVCDLKSTRFRDPATGKVYTPSTLAVEVIPR